MLGSTKQGFNTNDHILPTLVTEESIHKKKTNEVHRHEVNTPAKSERVLAGRKPIRAILLDLQKRIHQLKNNPSEWEALQKRVNKTRQNQLTQGQSDAIRRNVRIAWEMRPEYKFKLVEESVIISNLEI